MASSHNGLFAAVCLATLASLASCRFGVYNFSGSANSVLQFPTYTHGLGSHRAVLGRGGFELCLSSGDTNVSFVKKNDEEYEGWRSRTFNQMFLNRWPEYYIFPKETAEVSAAIKCCKLNGVPFVVRSGGHSYRGLSIAPCGAVIDMYEMKWVDLKVQDDTSDAPTAWVGAGVRLGPLYWYITQQKPESLQDKPALAFPGGSCPSVGLSGLLLSGGQGILTRKLGNTVDSVLGAEVVLADGETVMANASSYEDLFYAIRGGSGSYGIVTQWNLQLQYVPQVMASHELVWDWKYEKLTLVMRKLFDSKPWNWTDDFSEVRLYLEPFGANPLQLVLLYWGSKEEMQSQMDEISFFQDVQADTAIGPVDTTWIDEQVKEAAFRDPTKQPKIDDLQKQELYSSWGSKSFMSTYIPFSKNGGVLSDEGIEVLVDFVYKNPCATGTITFLGGKPTENVGGPTAFDAHRQNAAVIQVSASPGGSCPENEAYVKRFWSNFAEYGSGTQYYGYVYDVMDNEDPFQQYFGENGDKLKKIKKKYDPASLFNTFAVPKCKLG